MSPLLARVMLTIFMLPAAAAVYILLFSALDLCRRSTGLRRLLDIDTLSLFASGTTLLFVGAYWLLLWRRTVRWTPNRVQNTWFVSAAAVVVGGLAGWVCRGVDDGFGKFTGPFLVTTAWLIGTTLVWRQTAEERAEAVGGNAIACPSCGYNLTGLKATQCPECGTEFTLDQLLNSQRGREGAELA